MGKKFWKFTNMGNKKGRLELYGNISQETWWGDEVTPQLFQDDMDSLGDVNAIDVHINSPGGDVFAAMAIKSKLLDHPAEVTIIIDGWAASAATIVATAGRTVVYPGSTTMYHDPLIGLMGYYQAKDLDEVKDRLIKVKDSIIEAYQAKTGKSKEELVDMMKKETWMTAQEAVELGFADELKHAGKIEVTKNNEGNVLVNGVNFDIKNFHNTAFIDSLVTNVKEEPVIDKGINEEERILNKEDLKNKYPEIYNEIKNEGVEEERERIKAIDNLDVPGFQNIKDEAKYSEFMNAGQAAIKIVNAQKQQAANHVKNVQDDITNSGIQGVTLEPNPQNELSDDQKEDAIANSMGKFMNERRGL